MRQALHLIVLASAAFWLQACSPVVTTQPIGPRSPDDLSAYNGDWLVDDVVLKIQATDPGTISVARTEYNNGWRLSTYRGIVTQVGDQRLLHLLPENAPHWSFWLMRSEADHVTLFVPHATELAAAVEDGDLPGEVSYKDDGNLERVLIDARDAGVLSYFERARPEALFKLDKPVTLRRIKPTE